MKRLLLTAVLCLFAGTAFSQVTGLSGWNPYLDPGHSQKENMGVEGWSEAEHSLRVSNYLRAMLRAETDIDTVYASRTNDQQLVSLSQRTSHANQVGADFFYSIHSDAPSTTAHSTLMLYGGWRENGQTVEKTPHGGRAYGDILDVVLTKALRSGFRGNFADRTFYQGFPPEHANKWPYLHVNRVSVMASLLSEASFHTNPQHNMRQMNAEYQLMQARAAFWSFLDYHEIERPTNRVLGGQVSDVESGRLINGATITIGDRTYTTDTFESLFHRFTNDPGRLANGFYYFEELPAGELEVTFAAPGYASQTLTVTPADADFTFLDAALVSNVPPVVASSSPVDGAEAHRFVDPIVINFSRRMDRASTEAAFSIDPETEGTFQWSINDFTLTFRPAEHLDTQTEYTVRIAETARGHYDDPFDGDGDGEPGGEFVLAFTTGAADVTPPVLQAFHPALNATGVNRYAVPTLRYDEPLNPASVTGERVRLERVTGGLAVEGALHYYTVGERGVIQFFPDEELEANTEYRLVVAAGIEDMFGNATGGGGQIRFTTDNLDRTITSVDDFDGSFTDHWWQPTASGSTTGVEAESTRRFADTLMVAPVMGSSQSMGIQYGWNAEAGNTLSRTHLSGGPVRNVTFDRAYTMQAYVFGDGSGTQFRFAVRASNSGIGASPWTTIDWHGWRLVEWDIEHDGMINFHLDTQPPPYFMESIQLRRGPEADQYGTIYVDNLAVVRTQDISVSAPIAGDVPTQFVLQQNYPNPFNPTTTIPFEVPQAGQVSIRVYDILGKEVATLIDGDVASGRHEVSWNANDLPSGVYFARMEAGSARHTVKLVLLK
jgi:N-acetylmuramoyl-L-alanine amidase